MLNDNEGYIMKIIYSVIGIYDEYSEEIAFCKSLDDAIKSIRTVSVDRDFKIYRILVYQLSSSLSCRIIDRQLFIE